MSSYKQNNYGTLFSCLTKIYKPSTIVEIGILEGYSLSCFCKAAPSNATIRAYDIFDRFPYHHASYEKLRSSFGEEIIQRGDFWDLHKQLKPDIDFLHIDIANDGNIYEHCFRHYLPLVSPGGLILLEGGSQERDNYYWMKQFDKRPIRSVLNSPEWLDLNFIVLDPFPSLTIVSV